ncbi:MAG: ribonuclease HIII [Victivallaceae bacterium]|jgi:ribonuclease HIII|nr:ribonuclease HIII [Victivallaceae bacterium]MDD3116958.1 ribonuclease HIII [Victivallaceae bacterium]MDD3704328.1 ribonuclease HIII [Victivallaceae bacterium]MDD4317517.1 ribonuclease HIII [Victivallaceae bacterium]NLK82499.1 ribonuclease HIII [Lentisphaerota bacterium]
MNSEKTKTSYVVEVTEQQAFQLEKLLIEKGWVFSKVPYSRWKASKEKTSVVAYQSGKLTVQGQGTADFVMFVLEPDILKKAVFGYEKELGLKTEDQPAVLPPESFEPHAGVDESGKGDFFGPLVIAAVYVDEFSSRKLLEFGIKDSKAIKSDRKIFELAGIIRKTVQGKFAVVTVGNVAYNRLYGQFGNLNKLLAWGHARAIENILEKVPDCPRALSDKFAAENLIKDALMKHGRNIKLEQRVRAESDPAVAAASVLAREAFINSLKKNGEPIGMKLPRGGGVQADVVAAEIFHKHGEQVLVELCKKHFRNFKKVAGNQ